MGALSQSFGRKHDSPMRSHGLSRLEVSLAGSLTPLRVLVADDDPTTAELLASITEKPGYKVVSVCDGRQAYRLLKSDCDFQLAVFNMTMPRLEGVDIVRYMKTEKRLMRIPVVMVSGEQNLKAMADGFAAGAVACLPKPFSAGLLQRTLRVAMSSGERRKEIRRAA